MKIKLFIMLSMFSIIIQIFPEQPPLLKYAVIYQHNDKEIKSVDYSELSTKLFSGDVLKLYIKPSGLFVYVFLQDIEGTLSLLFPENIDNTQNYQINGEYYIPKGTDWFELDNAVGTETFYILASTERLSNLESLFKKYFSYLSNSGEQKQKVIEARQEVIEEIKRIKLEKATEGNQKEKIIQVACDFRGMTIQNGFQAVSVEVKNLYSKTIKIEH